MANITATLAQVGVVLVILCSSCSTDRAATNESESGTDASSKSDAGLGMDASDKTGDAWAETSIPTAYALGGVVQKGPFINGTPVTVRELDSNLTATGRVFSTNILDDTGAFELDSVQLISPYAELSADGFYFDEIAGDLSANRIQLEAVADVTNASAVNVNPLSHLEKGRAEYLVTTGLSFSAAKSQAQSEVLAIFGIKRAGMGWSETLDITKGGEDNAILLAISAILLGYHTTAELTQLLSNINTDIRQDGRLDSASTGAELINMARLLDLAAIRANLSKRYADMGITATIGDFEKYVKAFIANTSFVPTNDVIYPVSGQYGLNLLDLGRTVYPGDNVSLIANLPPGTSLWIRIRHTSGGLWGYTEGEHSGWDISSWNGKYQDFVAVQVRAVTQKRLDERGTATEAPPDMRLYFMGQCTVDIEYYENDATKPTRVKSITWGGSGDDAG